MTFEPLDLLAIAETMDMSTEARARTAINRAYYAIFLSARNNLVASGRMSSRGAGQEHGQVIHALRANYRHRAAQRLVSLRDLRQFADYETARTLGAREAREALEIAADVRTLLARDWGLA